MLYIHFYNGTRKASKCAEAKADGVYTAAPPRATGLPGLSTRRISPSSLCDFLVRRN